MKLILRPLFISSLLVLSIAVFSQTDGGSAHLMGSGVATPFATDYQAIGVNPANLTLAPQFEGKNISFGFADVNMSLYAEYFTRNRIDKLRDENKFDISNAQDRAEVANGIAGKDFSFENNNTLLGFAWHGNKIGAGVSVKSRVNMYATIGQKASELLFLGATAPYFDSLLFADGRVIANDPSLPQDTLDNVISGFVSQFAATTLRAQLEGTRLASEALMEINVSGGARIIDTEFLKLSGGLGIKYMAGFFLIDIDYRDGANRGFLAFSPTFDISLDTAVVNNPSAFSPGTNNLKPAGRGIGFDLGFTAVIQDKYTVSASVVDIGSMKWNGNVFSVTEKTLLEVAAGGIDGNGEIDLVESLTGADGPIQWKGSQEIVTSLPTRLRLGAGVRLLENKIEVGVDYIAPLTESVGNFEKGLFGIGVNASPVPMITGSLGLTTSDAFSTRIPAGLTIAPAKGSAEFSIATPDMLILFDNDANQAGFGFAVLRFRI